MSNDVQNMGRLDRLFAAFAQFDEIYSAFAKTYGETHLSLWALEEIGCRPQGVTQKELSALLFAPKQTVSSVVASLTKRGLVRDEPSTLDGRSKIHLLTGEGQALYDEVRAVYTQAEAHAVQTLGAERLDSMFDTMSLLAESMGATFSKEGERIG